MVKTIVCADDDESWRVIVKRSLGRNFPDHSIEVFEDGDSLNKRLTRDLGEVCLVVTDDQMPGVEGSEIIREHARRLDGLGIPMILYYAGDQEIGEEAVKNGAYGYASKADGSALFNYVISEAMNSGGSVA